VVAFPTESAYGLSADPVQPSALEKVMAAKGRPEDKRLPLVAASMGQVRRFFTLSGKTLKLAKKYWPGPLTLVLKRQTGSGLPGWPEAAIRVPSAPWARSLPDALGRPVTATSANLSGQPPCYSGVAVRRAFRGRAVRPDLLLDAGCLPKRPPSTIIKVDRGRIIVLRPGPIIDTMFD
jgi:L-threonylcarbamoyladenylate synthase